MDSLKENGELSHSSERSFLKTQDKRWSWVVCPVSKQVYEIWERGTLQGLFWLDACGRGGWRELLGLCLKQRGEGMLPTQQVTGHRAQGGVNLVTLLCSSSVSYLREREECRWSWIRDTETWGIASRSQPENHCHGRGSWNCTGKQAYLARTSRVRLTGKGNREVIRALGENNRVRS